METWMSYRTLSAVLAGLVVALGGCGNTDESQDLCKGPELLPNRSPVSLGEIFPPSEDIEPNPGDNTRTPVEWTVLLESTCRESVEISETCVVGENDENSDQSDAQFFEMLGPTKTSVPTDEETAVRLSYEREAPNREDDVDNIALVVQSNATNFPTLVVPLCGRVIETGEDPGAVTCESPIEAPPKGEKKSDICPN